MGDVDLDQVRCITLIGYRTAEPPEWNNDAEALAEQQRIEYLDGLPCWLEYRKKCAGA
jgi:hypothetical protein